MAKRYYNMEAKAEQKDAAMIKSDFSKLANLPTEVIMKEYPPCPAYMNDMNYPDDVRGIDKALAANNRQRNAGAKPHKY